MPRQIKYDDIPFERPNYSGKVFMYLSSDWDILFPVVDVIRLFKKDTIISYKIGKNQNTIRLYGTKYYHRVYCSTVTTRQDYINVLNKVKCIFIFTNGSDSIATNLINLAEKGSIPLICYSTVDSLYHFYNDAEHLTFKSVQDVINHMYMIFDISEIKKIAELFPDFEIIPETVEAKENELDKCVKILKESNECEKDKKDLNKILFFDGKPKPPPVVEGVETLTQKIKKLNILERFFKK